MTLLERQRRSQRYAIVRALGLRGEDAETAAQSGRRFVECLRALDAAAYPAQLTRTGPGGRARNDTPRNAQRRRRYRVLRQLGLASAAALAASKSAVRFAQARAEVCP